MKLETAMWAGGMTLCLLLFSGCEGKPSGSVTGSVTLDGQPVELGAISFIPVDGQAPTTGGPIQNGQYSVPKVPIGEMKVAISGSKVVGKKKLYEDQPDSPEMPI